MSDEYDVGYKKPPAATRFRKGESGNPGGRRKGSKNLATMVQEALNAKVLVTINGRRRKVSKLEAALIQQSNKAASGDPKAIKLLLDVLSVAQARDEAVAHEEVVSPQARREENAAILTALRDRLTNPVEEDVDG